MDLPDSYQRPGYVYATAPLRFSIVTKEDMLAFMFMAASMKSSGVDSALICLLVPGIIVYIYKRLTRGNAPGTLRYWLSLKLGGAYKTPYIGIIFKNISESYSDMWKKSGSISPPTYRDHYEP